MLLTLTGCGNSSIGFGNYDFNIVHIADYAGHCVDCEIDTWYQSTSNCPGIEVALHDGNSLFLSEGTYILAKDYCPICDPDGGK